MHHAGSVPLSQVSHAAQPSLQQSTVAAAPSNEAAEAEQRKLQGVGSTPSVQAGQLDSHSQPGELQQEDGAEMPPETAILRQTLLTGEP